MATLPETPFQLPLNWLIENSYYWMICLQTIDVTMVIIYRMVQNSGHPIKGKGVRFYILIVDVLRLTLANENKRNMSDLGQLFES